eukprot:6100983-Alexandrium_andersonii.AAC.1
MRSAPAADRPASDSDGGHMEQTEKVVQGVPDPLGEIQLAKNDECEAMQQVLEGVVNPIKLKDHQAAKDFGGKLEEAEKEPGPPPKPGEGGDSEGIAK